MLLVLVQGRTGTMDPRMQQPPFSDNAVTYIVHRHNLRVCQSYCNAVRASLQNRVRLYVSVACDTAEQGDRASRAFSEDVRVELLRENNLRKLQYSRLADRGQTLVWSGGLAVLSVGAL